MSSLPVDPTFALQNANYNDAVQRKLSMDALRKRLGDGRTEEQKLRESCEGFESLFIQKMWEQMRKTLPKEGYLHSKDEETYQSMFDVELAKKMSSAGGIGLADMLYDQLSQKLTTAARTTSGAAIKAAQNQPVQADEMPVVKNMTLDSLYSTLDSNAVDGDEQSQEYATMYSAVEPPQPEEPDLVLQALADLEVMVAQSNPAQEAVLAGSVTNAVAPPKDKEPDASVLAGQPASGTRPVKQRFAPGENIEGQSWLSTRKVSARPSPIPKGSGFTDIEKRVAEVNAGDTEINALPNGQGHVGPAASLNSSDKQVERASSVSGVESSPGASTPLDVKASVDPTNNTEPSIKSVASANFTWLPVAGEVVRPFGWEKTASGSKWHNGVLIGSKAGELVQSPLDGRVVFVGEKTGLGQSVVIEHAKGYQSIYGNVSVAEGLSVGSTVQAGTNFAKVLAGSPATAQEEGFAFMQLLVKRGEMPLDPEKTFERIATAGR